uniref:Fibronectin type-III domain-containing protein n=1 Tax=Schistocephalus solidus TaxID=70667 RepID=A0A183SQM4_SCHSO
LRPAVRYFIKACCIYEGLMGSFSETADFVTLSTKPSVLRPPVVMSKTKNSLSIRWTSSADNGSRITEYCLQFATLPKAGGAAPSQLHLPRHGLDAQDSGPLQDFHVRDHVLSSQLQYSAEAAEMEVIQLPGWVRVDGPDLRSVKECLQDDCLLYLQFSVQLNTVAIPHGGL